MNISEAISAHSTQQMVWFFRDGHLRQGYIMYAAAGGEAGEKGRAVLAEETAIRTLGEVYLSPPE